MTPLVSVIIPSYNHEKFVRECIESVLNQTFQDFEIIVTDDCSTDRTVDIIKTFDDPRIKLFVHSQNRGACVAANNCIQHSSGKYIAMLSSDDAWYPEKLAIQVQYLEEHPNIAAVFGKVDWIDESGNLITFEGFPFLNLFEVENRTRHEWLALFFKFGNCLCHPSSLIRKDAYYDVGLLNPAFANLPDFDLWVRLCLKYDIMILDQKLLRYRWMSDNSNASSDTKHTFIRISFEYKQMLDHYLEITKPEDVMAIFPEASQYGKVTSETIPYFLGRIAIETGLDLKVSWGEEAIYALLQDETIARTLEENCNFTHLDFIKLTAEHDIYHLGERQTLSEQLTAHVQAVQTLIARVTERDKSLDALTTQLADREHDLKEIRTSRVWKFALFLRRVRMTLLPPGSVRSRLLGKAARVILFPYKKLVVDQKIQEDLDLIRSSKLFDEKWYLEQNPDVAESGVDPLRHYLLVGGFEGRNPHPNFHSDWYLNAYKDVKQTGINPLVHFLKFGMLEGRTMQKDQLVREAPPNQMTKMEQELRELHQPQDPEVEPPDTNLHLHNLLASDEMVELPEVGEPVVSVILLFHNRAEMSLQCLQSLQEGTGNVPFEVVIVDNASTDQTPALLDHIRNARIIRNPTNTGFGGGCNQAAEFARGKYLLFLNNDTRLLPNALQALVETLESDPRIGAVGGKLIFPDGRLQEAGSLIWQDGSCLGYGRFDDPFKPEYCYVRDVDYCSGALLLTPRELFLSQGKFDPRYAPAYYEDVDYCLALWTSGYRVVFQPFAAAIHYEYGTSGSEKALAMQRERQQIFADKWRESLHQFALPDPASIVSAREHPSEATRILFIDDRIPDYRIGHGYPRTYRMLELLATMGYKLTFLPLQLPTPVPEIAEPLQKRGVEVLYKKTTENPELEALYNDPNRKFDLQAFLGSRPDYYDVVFVSRPLNMQEIRPHLKTHASRATIVYDAEALFTLRDLKYRELNGETIPESEKEKLVDAEVALIRDADVVTTVSEYEKSHFVKHGASSVHVLGHIVEPTPTPASFEERKDILFIGSILFDPSPNGDAVRYFANHILPLVREKVDCHFYIVGTNHIKSIWNMESEHVHVTGKVEDLTPYYNRSRLFVVPTRFSAGIPLKLVEAAAHGLPAVVTPLTALQLGWQEGYDLLVGHNPKDFAKRVIDLYTRKDLFESVRQHALERIQREYSPEYFSKTLEQIFNSTINKTTLSDSLTSYVKDGTS